MKAVRNTRDLESMAVPPKYRQMQTFHKVGLVLNLICLYMYCRVPIQRPLPFFGGSSCSSSRPSVIAHPPAEITDVHCRLAWALCWDFTALKYSRMPFTYTSSTPVWLRHSRLVDDPCIAANFLFAHMICLSTLQTQQLFFWKQVVHQGSGFILCKRVCCFSDSTEHILTFCSTCTWELTENLRKPVSRVSNDFRDNSDIVYSVCMWNTRCDPWEVRS